MISKLHQWMLDGDMMINMFVIAYLSKWVQAEHRKITQYNREKSTKMRLCFARGLFRYIMNIKSVFSPTLQCLFCKLTL